MDVQGRLSPRQKTTLLSDIIEHARTDATPSAVEVAFNIIVGFDSGTGDEAADLEARMEDFAQQCRSFADQMG